MPYIESLGQEIHTFSGRTVGSIPVSAHCLYYRNVRDIYVSPNWWTLIDKHTPTKVYKYIGDRRKLKSI